ncbi:MAG: alpha/beta fold hydrolase [Acidimicrobiales bacterium]|nr:alpha/beta fold hydrolase [Acidimicrobiales bacterium]
MTTTEPGVKTSTVLSGTAVLALYERGEPTPDRPSIVMVHGWPDSHAVWDLVADRLHAEGHHVVTYDVRGVGDSTPALVHRPYTLDKMAADIGAVIDAVSPGRPVHLVGHDWGGVEGWEYVSGDACDGRVVTFTTVSGPNLDHLGHLMRTSVKAALVQGPKSLYTLVLSVPIVRTVMWRLGMASAFRRWLRVTEGIRPEDGYPDAGLAQHAIAAVPLYRTNIFGRMRSPEIRPARVPVHQLVARKDNYVSASVLAHSAQWADDFTRTEIDAGHWSPRTHPDDVARHLSEYFSSRTRSAA